MIITYMRSSSYSSYSLCPQQFTLNYVLGIRDPGNIKAAKGNVVHKALEGLARKKLAIQNGDSSFTEDDTGIVFDVATSTEEDFLKLGWEIYSKRDSHHDWNGEVFEWCKKVYYDTLKLHGGIWNPLNREIVKPEEYFDLSIDEPWAKYRFTTPSGKKLEGQLAIKGTVDLVTSVGDGVLEYLDWKTGLRLDWATGEIKDYKKLRDDPQLRMYHYALTRLYPDMREIIMTIAFVQECEVVKSTKKKKGVPNQMVVSLPFGPEDIPVTLNMLRKRFETIRDCAIPKRKVSWRCTAFCHFGRTKQPGTDQTICDFMYQKMKQNGLNAVITEYGDESKLGAYGDGGGRQGVE